MPTVVLYCRLCWAGTAIRGAEPKACPTCRRQTRWQRVCVELADRKPSARQGKFTLTDDDKRFLRGLRIRRDPEDCFDGRPNVD